MLGDEFVTMKQGTDALRGLRYKLRIWVFQYLVTYIFMGTPKSVYRNQFAITYYGRVPGWTHI